MHNLFSFPSEVVSKNGLPSGTVSAYLCRLFLSSISPNMLHGGSHAYYVTFHQYHRHWVLEDHSTRNTSRIRRNVENVEKKVSKWERSVIILGSQGFLCLTCNVQDTV